MGENDKWLISWGLAASLYYTRPFSELVCVCVRVVSHADTSVLLLFNVAACFALHCCCCPSMMLLLLPRMPFSRTNKQTDEWTGFPPRYPSIQGSAHLKGLNGYSHPALCTVMYLLRHEKDMVKILL